MDILELEERIRRLEEELRMVKQLLPEEERAVLFEKKKIDPALSILDVEEVKFSKNIAIIQLGKDSANLPSFQVRTKDNTVFEIEAGGSLTIKASKYLHCKIPTVYLETDTISIEGSLAAKLKSSQPYIWRKGQERIKLHHFNRGFPVVTHFAAHQQNVDDVLFRVYVDPADNYWYMEGGKTTEVIEAIFVGKT